jgi:hypothetical protein
VHHHGQKIVGQYLVNYLEEGKWSRIMGVSFFPQLVLLCGAALRVNQPLKAMTYCYYVPREKINLIYRSKHTVNDSLDLLECFHSEEEPLPLSRVFHSEEITSKERLHLSADLLVLEIHSSVHVLVSTTLLNSQRLELFVQAHTLKDAGQTP